jgi:NADPH2:quinone reductase
VGSPAKAELARAHGCAETVLGNDPDFVAKVKSLSGGGVAVVYDSIGKDTFMQSLDCLRRHGTMVTFGNASGPVEPFSPMELAKRGSLHLTRPSLFDFIASKADLDAGAGELFGVIGSGAVKIGIGQRYALKDVAQAHRDLESRKTTGSTVLLP